MYNVEIGRRVLTLHNSSHDRQLTAQQFFDEVMFPVFFDTNEDHLHLMQVGNSSFFQSFPDKDRVTGHSLGYHKHRRHLAIIKDVESGRKAVSGAIAVGYQASGPTENTAGQVSNIRQKIDAESIAFTWLGAACGIGIAGGMNLLIDHKLIINHTVAGWPYYRRFLDENTTFKGRQIETWNGLWMVYALDAPSLEEGYRRVMDNLGKHQSMTAKGENSLAERPDWFKHFINLSKVEGLPQTFQAYVYKYGQMNTTYGFLSITLTPFITLTDIFAKLLNQQYLFSESFETLKKIFEAHYGVPALIKAGGISIRTLRPAKIDAFMKANKPIKSDNNPLYPTLIKAWIIAMLNNDQLADLARDLARALRSIEKESRETATKKIEDLLDASTKPLFINAANELMSHKGVLDKHEQLHDEVFLVKQAIDAAQRQIPTDQLPLFRALTKSEYIVVKYFNPV